MFATEASSILRSKLNKISAGPANLHTFANLPEMRNAFFPGGNGLYDGATSDVEVPIPTMIVGSNFGCRSGFVDELGELLVQDERGNRTWSPMLTTLTAARIDPRTCFFTNAFPFLHEGDSNVTNGLLRAWLKDEGLMNKCMDFMRETIGLMRPREIITLGLESAAFFSSIFPKELGIWSGLSIRSLDAKPFAKVQVNDSVLKCAALTHPCKPNAWQRQAPYQHRVGEAKLLQDMRGG